MDNHIIWGILYSVIVLIGLGIFFYNLGSYKRFMDLTTIGKLISAILTILSVSMILSGSSFAYTNFTYSPPPRDDVMAELEEVVITSNFNEDNYKPTISKEEMDNLETNSLLSLYNPKGQADIRSIAQGSALTTDLILRNVGVKLIEEENRTMKLDLLSGKTVDLSDGVDRLLVFVDNSSFSSNQLKVLYDYNNENKYNPLDYVVIFPTISGTEVEEFFKTHSSEIGDVGTIQVVTHDSMPSQSGELLLYLTQGEYHINNLPAYISIDKHGIISNAGVGTIFKSVDTLKTFLRRSFTDGNKLYLQIQESRDLGIKEAEKNLEGIIEGGPTEGSNNNVESIESNSESSVSEN